MEEPARPGALAQSPSNLRSSARSWPSGSGSCSAHNHAIPALPYKSLTSGSLTVCWRRGSPSESAPDPRGVEFVRGSDYDYFIDGLIRTGERAIARMRAKGLLPS